MKDTAERRIEIIKYLCRCRKTTVAHLAVEFGVGESTIRRDLTFLTLKHPIETKRGHDGGVYISDKYYLYKQYLTNEQESLIRKYIEQAPEEEKSIWISILSDFSKPNAS